MRKSAPLTSALVNQRAVLRPALFEAIADFRKDAARWVRPQEIAAAHEVTPAVVLRLLVRHIPLRAMAWFRLASLLQLLGAPLVAGWTQRRLLRLYGLELMPGGKIGGGFYIAHPVGCVLVADRIGSNVTVIGQVTFGTRTDSRWPSIGDGVFVGAGARVLGGITIGDRAQIGANAVVVHDVPPDTTVVGVPARSANR
jgi:serine O-acetyltransferase